MSKKYEECTKRYLTKYVGISEERLKIMNKNEVFDECLRYEGYGMFAGYNIRNIIEAVYGINLSQYEEYLTAEASDEIDE